MAVQFKLFSVPVIQNDSETDTLNAFLRSHRIVSIEKHLITSDPNCMWAFCIQYYENGVEPSKTGQKTKVDYKQVLTEEQFAVFQRLRCN